jgi:tRNA(Arg) A34 adenosine deaminase TadA
MTATENFLRQAVELARGSAKAGGRPFGAVIVKDGAVVATGVNEVNATGDPTAHAELQAIRAASKALRSPTLDGCIVYASGHPCPMCLAAMYLTGIREAAYAYSLEDGEPYGLSTAAIYEEFGKAPGARSLKATYVPIGDRDLYEGWKPNR